jgi:hypothetical protein
MEGLINAVSARTSFTDSMDCGEVVELRDRFKDLADNVDSGWTNHIACEIRGDTKCVHMCCADSIKICKDYEVPQMRFRWSKSAMKL